MHVINAPEFFQGALEDLYVSCDICQTICPHTLKTNDISVDKHNHIPIMTHILLKEMRVYIFFVPMLSLDKHIFSRIIEK